MSEFGDISRMNLSELDRKGMVDQEIEEDELHDEVEADNEEQSGDGNPDKEKQPEMTKDSVQEEASKEEAASEKEHMADPVGKHYYIDAKVTAREMRAFLFAHNYRSPVLIIAILVGVVWPIYSVVKQNGSVLMAVVCAAIFLVLMPFSIWYRGGANVKQNPTYENTFHYMLDEAGVHLELGDRAIDVEWKEVIRVMCLKSSTALFTGKTNAFLVPTNAMGDRREEINSFIKSHAK